MIRIKRVYDKAKKDDGVRILVDRVWPRGVSKQEAKVDIWLKAVAPSSKLRKWFGHKPGRWKEFRKRYRKELDNWKEVLLPTVRFLEDDRGSVTLLFAAKDEKHNNAVVLRDYLK